MWLGSFLPAGAYTHWYLLCVWLYRVDYHYYTLDLWYTGLGSVFFLLFIVACMALRLRYCGHQHQHGHITSWKKNNFVNKQRETITFREEQKYNAYDNECVFQNKIIQSNELCKMKEFRPEKKTSEANDNDKSIPLNLCVDSHLRFPTIKLENNTNKANSNRKEILEVNMRIHRNKMCSTKSVSSNNKEELQIKCPELNKNQRKEVTNLKCSVFYCDEGCFHHFYPYSELWTLKIQKRKYVKGFQIISLITISFFLRYPPFSPTFSVMSYIIFRLLDGSNEVWFD